MGIYRHISLLGYLINGMQRKTIPPPPPPLILFFSEVKTKGESLQGLSASWSARSFPWWYIRAVLPGHRWQIGEKWDIPITNGL